MSRAIVRAGRAVALTNPYARAGYLTAKYGPTAARAAWRIGKWAVKRYRKRGRSGYRAAKRARFSKTRIGERVGSANCKRSVQATSDYVTNNSRTLYTIELTQIPKGDNIDERETNIVNCRGFKINMFMANTSFVPLYVNVAVLSNKFSGVAPPATVSFFRSSGINRGLDFSNLRTAMEFHSLPINTDAYSVLRHKRYRLTEKGGSNFKSNRGASYKNIRMWIKLKRQLRFELPTDESPSNGRVYLVYWCDQVDANGASTPITNVLGVQERHVCYFKDRRT